MWLPRLLKQVGLGVLVVLLGGLLGAVLVRAAPGFGVEQGEIDPRLTKESVQALRQAHAGEQNAVRFYASYLAGMLKGNLGFSRSLNRPVRELLSERLPRTLRSMTAGLAAGWISGLALALLLTLARLPAGALLALWVSGALLCLPSAVVALLFLYAGGTAGAALAVVVFPRVFRYARNLLAEACARPHVLTARAKGLGEIRVLLRHVLPAAAPQLAALAGISVNLAFGASIPIEVICDSPGLGQLAWQAALARDLPLLVNLTLLVTLLTLAANSASELIAAGSASRP